jgi:hypothetical protein
MDNTQRPRNDAGAGVQFTVDLDQIELTDEECAAFQNAITKLAVEYVQKHSDTVTARVRREPYVKIIFVKAIPPNR